MQNSFITHSDPKQKTSINHPELMQNSFRIILECIVNSIETINNSFHNFVGSIGSGPNLTALVQGILAECIGTAGTRRTNQYHQNLQDKLVSRTECC